MQLFEKGLDFVAGLLIRVGRLTVAHHKSFVGKADD